MPVADWLPQRYSVDAPDFDPELSRHLLIALDGVEQDQVIEYDATCGRLTRYVTGPDGRLTVDRAKGEAMRETLHGLVTVNWKA